MMESVKWQWYNEDPDGSNDDIDNLDDDASDDAIAKAKSDTYTPKKAGRLTLMGMETHVDGKILHVWGYLHR